MPAAPSLLASSLEALFAAQTGTAGKRTVKINGKEYERLGDEIDHTDSPEEGNLEESGTIHFAIRVSDHPKKPEQLAEVRIGGLTLELKTAIKVNGLTWEITAGGIGKE